MCCDCFFCRDKRFYLNEMLELNTQNWIVYQNAHVFITPDIAPIKKGHFLIVADEHINGFANGSRAVYDALVEAEKYLKQNIYKSNKVMFFEHGAVIPHTAGGCIDHAHIHAIPFENNVNVNEFLRKYYLLDTPEIPVSYDNLRDFGKKQKPYILYETENGGFIRSANKLPSQFFRLLVSVNDSKEYNWKLVYKTEISKRLLKETLNMGTK